jgi:hypothetical protein
MKKFILVAIIGLSFVGGFSGCSLLNPKSPVTWEASRFLAFKDVWKTTLALYDHAKDLNVAGKLSDRDMADIDAAWNLFRAAFKTALAESENNNNGFTPENVRKLGNDVLTLIYAAQ